MRVLSLLIAVALANTALASNLSNKDVRAFVSNADMCEHFAGEWDSELPIKEQKNIEQAIDKYCSKAQRQMKCLQRKYKGDSEIEKLLDEYESVKSYSN
jgi:hypothetical protein